ncbi:MAG TPA: energy transducer TonB, partial [bacterium]|nr:energy transducer TonB [bacterium]
ALMLRPAQYGLAPARGSADASRPREAGGARDLQLTLSDQAWSAAPRRAKAAPPARKAPAPGPGEVRAAPGLHNPPPPYPEEARRLGQQGTVVLEVEVDDQGRARSVRVARSSGYPLLDGSAKGTVQQWRFEPFRLGGVAVPGSLELPIIFNLQGQTP